MIFFFLFLGCDFYLLCLIVAVNGCSGSSNVSPLIMISLACQDVSHNQTYPLFIHPSIHPSIYAHKQVEEERQGGREKRKETELTALSTPINLC